VPTVSATRPPGLVAQGAVVCACPAAAIGHHPGGRARAGGRGGGAVRPGDLGGPAD